MSDSMSDNSDKDNTSRPETVSTEKGYQDHPDSAEELENAIESVPIKDYSDYEITIESKEHYEDALFSDLESLGKSLKQNTAAEKPEAAAAKVSAKSSSNKTKKSSNNTPPQSQPIDFTSFLSPLSKAGRFSLNNELTSTAHHLKATEGGINLSPVCDDIVYEDDLDETEEKVSIEKPSDTTANEDIDLDFKAQSKEPEAYTFKQRLLIKAQKLQSKAKEKLDKSKNQFDEYAGISLPERLLPLEFSLAPQKPKKEFESIVSKHDIEQLFSMKRPLISVLKRCSEELTKVQKCDLSHSNRKNILDSYLAVIPEKIQAVIASFQRKPSVPADAKKRLEVADHAGQVNKLLISGYKQLYAELYQSKNVLYGPQRKTANLIAYTLIDLLYLEQLLCTTLHTPLPTGSAKTLNKIFHALSLYEPEQIDICRYACSLDNKASVKTLFLLYQIGLAFDFNTLSSAEHKTFRNYIQHSLGLLKIVSPTSKPPTNLFWIIPHNNSGAGLFNDNTPLDQQFPAIIIQLNRFFNHIKQDYEECLDLMGGKGPKHSSSALDALNINEALSLLSQLNLSVLNIEQQLKRPIYSLYNPIALVAYSGITDCAGYFNYSYTNDAVKPPASKGQWLCAAEDALEIQLKTDESRVGITLDIGIPLLLIRTIEDDEGESIEQQQLAHIVRLERGQQGKISIVAKKIGGKVTAVKLTAIKSKEVAALICVQSEISYLLAGHEHGYWSEKTIELTFLDNTQSIVSIDSLIATTKQIQLLSLL
jgi:hypothetical protein